jgi:hypothetical protein
MESGILLKLLPFQLLLFGSVKVSDVFSSSIITYILETLIYSHLTPEYIKNHPLSFRLLLHRRANVSDIFSSSISTCTSTTGRLQMLIQNNITRVDFLSGVIQSA